MSYGTDNQYIEQALTNEPSEYHKRLGRFIEKRSDIKKDGYNFTDECIIKEIIKQLVQLGGLTPTELQRQILREVDTLVPLKYIWDCTA